MGKKKQRPSVYPASKLPTPAVESLAPEILREGLQTVEKLEQGECIMALKMIKKSIFNHGGSPHLRFLEALVHHRLAGRSAKDFKDKLMHLDKAISSAKSAWEKLPNSLCFALLVVDILYQRAILKLEDWEFVIQQCEKALSIENPTEPGVDKFLEDAEMQNSSKESRIEYEKTQIFKYLRASKLQASIKPCFVEIGKAAESKNHFIIALAKMKYRMKEIETIIGNWIVEKQRAIYFRIKKVKGNAEKAKKYKDFWSSKLSVEKKEALQKIQIENLENHFYSLDHYLVPDLREAISFAEEYGTWKYWECCNEKFGDCDMYRNHLRKSHGSNLELAERKVRREWIEIILKGEWKPMATDMARKFIVNQLKLESVKEEGVQDSVGDKSDTNMSSRTYMDNQKWPACADKNREEILEKILEGIYLLLRNNCLAMTHLHWAILYTFEKFEIVIPLPQLCPVALKFICFLEASHLEYLLKYFDRLANACGLIKNHELGSYLDHYISDDTVSDMKEEVRFSEDFSHLLVYKNDVLLENEDLVSWLYEGVMTGEDLESHTSLRDSQREKSKLLCRIYEVERSQLEALCKSSKHADLLGKIEAIEVLESIYLEETMKMEKDRGHAALFFFNTLTKEHKDMQFLSYENIAFIIKSEPISSILGEALAATSSYQSRIQEGVSEDELGKQVEKLTEIDNRLRLALQTMLKTQIGNMAFIDAVCLRGAAAIQKYEPVLEKINFYDYRPMVGPLLMSYLQTNLENLFFMEAVDVFLADIDAKESTEKGHDSVSKKQKSNRNNKKKIFQIAEESKGTDGGKNTELHQDGEDDNLSPKIRDSMSFDKVEESIPTDERLPEEFSEDHNESETEPNLKVIVLGVGVKYEALDCFLNVVIQSLWRLVEFREELMSRPKACHKHIHENACIFCAFRRIFAALSKASADKEGEAVDLFILRSVLITHTSLFRKEEMHNAFDCVRVILESFHDSMISILRPEYVYDCSTVDCLVHRIFGWNHHVRIYCGDCDLESGHQKTTPLFCVLSAIHLRMMKAEDARSDSSFDELLKLIQMNGRMTCNQCRKWKEIHHTILCLPPVFTMVLAWPEQVESSEDISRTLSAVSAELNLSVMFQGQYPNSEYFLVSMVCFYGDQEHYICFNYDEELKKYVLYDDAVVEVTGSWEDVVDTCKTSRLQPFILFFNQKYRINLRHLQSQ